MKNSIRVIALASLMMLCLSGCYSVKMVAPPGKNITLAPETEQLPYKTQKRNWYILFGLIPLNDNTTRQVIDQNNLYKVRVESKHTFLDYVISAFTGFVTVTTNTTIIEGAAER
jgi:hypothetical protein